jgi:hypothetical protein
MGTRALGAIAVIATFASPASAPVARAQSANPQCRPTGAPITIPDLSEASGIASSRRNSGTTWAVNDSGQPVIYALDERGAVTGRVRVTGATVDDWEAIAVGPCPSGNCLFVGDIGDNNASRKQITIYRVSEPAASGESTAQAEALHATYPDGPQDAETLLTSPDGRLFVVTKGETGAVALYRFPGNGRPGATVQLERLGKPREARTTKRDDRITDGAMSPHGDWVVLRTPRALIFYKTSALLAGNWQPSHEVSLTDLREPQGEGVTFGANGTIVVAGEGGGKSSAGTMARLSCSSLR